MSIRLNRWVRYGGLAAVLAASGAVVWWMAPGSEHSRATRLSAHGPMLEAYCLDCHNDLERAGDLTLHGVDLANAHTEPELWEAVVRKLNGGLMPPPGRPRPPREEVDRFVSGLTAALDEAAARDPDPGHVVLHRLNRHEYANAVEDLLGVRVEAEDLLPPDAVSEGFENIADVLRVSPTFLDQYINAARAVSIRAVGELAPKPGHWVYLAPEGNQSIRLEGMPLGTRGGMLVRHYFPADGEYELTIGGLAGARYVYGVDHPHTVIVTVDERRVFEAELGGEDDFRAIDQGQYPAVEAIMSRFGNIRVQVEAGERDVAVTFVARSLAESDEVLQPYDPVGGMDRMPVVEQLDISGPFNVMGIGDTESRAKIFTCRPASAAEESSCAAEILGGLARRAFRRPVTEDDLDVLLGFYANGHAHGGFEAGVQQGIMAMLASPKFLFRGIQVPESHAGDEAYRLSDIELASRLAFFLWGSVPDDELLDAAIATELRHPQVLDAQVRRMLADPRSGSLVRGFAFQWLRVNELDNLEPRDPALYPEMDDSLIRAFRREMELFVDSIFREDSSVLELLTADHTFVNARLAGHYGLSNVISDEFQRVRLDDPRRFGLLGKGALLTVTSYPHRTSPVLRGAWVLENLIGAPPAAPPPDVETDLVDEQAGAQPSTIRERLAEHRRNPSCNQCHGVMDVLGLALENFNAIGQWRDRDRYADVPIDASGELTDGVIVSGPEDLRAALLARPEQFVQTLTEKLMTYALGRSVEYRDMPAIRAIVRQAAKDDYRFSSIVLGIVNSDQMQSQRLPEGPSSPEMAAAAAH